MELTVRRILIHAITVILMLFGRDIGAAWKEPVAIVQGNWGIEDSEFGLKIGSIKDIVPSTIVVLSDGKIIVDDEVNGKLKIYSATGLFLKSIRIKSIGFYGLDLDKIVSGKLDEKGKTKIGVYSLSSENWLWIDNRDIGFLPDLSVLISINNKDIYVWNNYDKGYRYSSTGTLLETYSTKPLVFGKEEVSQKTTDGNYLSVIRFNDAIFSFKTPSGVSSFIRDASGYLYGIARVGENEEQHTRVHKITKCGKLMATIDLLPDRKRSVKYTDPLPAYSVEIVDEEYGEPFISPNGDVYTWKRTPDNYSILKWTWVDDSNVPTGPDAPSGLTLMPSTTGIYLTWTASPSDPGCVTGYEVARATSAGGVLTTVATVDKGVIKYNDTTATVGTTYYYKVRAVAGSEYSPFTSEVSGKR